MSLVELLGQIVQNLVLDKGSVQVSEEKEEGEDETRFVISISASDMGRIIGKQGRMINALRILMKQMGYTNNRSVSIDVIDSKPQEEK